MSYKQLFVTYELVWLNTTLLFSQKNLKVGAAQLAWEKRIFFWQNPNVMKRSFFSMKLCKCDYECYIKLCYWVLSPNQETTKNKKI